MRVRAEGASLAGHGSPPWRGRARNRRKLQEPAGNCTKQAPAVSCADAPKLLHSCYWPSCG
eukprot:13177464-Alexandrium_andersonii.AAC.1